MEEQQKSRKDEALMLHALVEKVKKGAPSGISAKPPTKGRPRLTSVYARRALESIGLLGKGDV